MSKPIFHAYQCSLTDNLNIPNRSHPALKTEDIDCRIEKYGLMSLVNPEYDVLDIGSAEGLFCIRLSPHVKSTTGVDPIPSHIQSAQNFTQKYNLTNCNWICKDFITFCQNNTQQFDLVLCFAAHSYIIGTHKRCHWGEGEIPAVDFEGFSKHLIQLIKPDGYLVLEGHPDFDADHQDWEPLMKLLLPKLSLQSIGTGRPSRPLGIFKKEF